MYFYKKKLKILLNKNFKKDFKIKLYKKYFLKILKFSKCNFNLLKYDHFFYLFKNLDLKDLNKILNILKKLKIKIFKNIPFKFIENVFENKKEKKITNSKKYKIYLSKSNIKEKYFYIDNYLKTFSKYFLKNLFLVSKIFNSNKSKNFVKFINKIKHLKTDLNIFSFFNIKIYKKLKILKKIILKKKTIKIKKTIYFNYNFILKKSFNLLNFLTNNIIKFNFKNKNYYYKIINKFLKKKIFKFEINLDMLDNLYSEILKNIKLINNLKDSLYDTINNLFFNFSYLEYNYLFLKNEDNFEWILNLLEFKNDKILKNSKIYNILIFNLNKIKNSLTFFKKKYSSNLKNLYKIFNTIELNNFKIVLIRNNIIKFKIKKCRSLIFKNELNWIKNDLYQEGILGLIKSINNFNYNSNFNFESYLIYNIKKFLFNYRYNLNYIIKIPFYVLNILKKINKFEYYYNSVYGYDPSLNQISKNLNVSINRITDILSINKIPISLEKPAKNSELIIDEIISDNSNLSFEDKIFKDDLNLYISELMINLNNRSANILKMRHGIDVSRIYTLSEIGNLYNLSRERVRQIQNFIIQKIKSSSDLDKLFNFYNYILFNRGS